MIIHEIAHMCKAVQLRVMKEKANTSPRNELVKDLSSELDLFEADIFK